MTHDAFITIMSGLGYSEIASKWIRLSNIARINLTSNTTLHREETNDLLAYYYYDDDHNLLYKAAVNPDGSVIGVTMILDISEITSIETRNAMSASLFTGNTY